MPLRRLLICFVFLTGLKPSFSQLGSITGIIMDSTLRTPVQDAYIELKLLSNLVDTNKARHTITDRDGKFIFLDVAPNKYRIRVSLGSYSDTTFILDVGDNVNQNIGTIYLQPKYAELNTVEVSAQRQLLIIDVGKITFLVDKDTTLRNKMAYDALMKLPFVNADISGTLNYKNGKRYLVLVNGQRYGLVTKEPSIVLKSIPVSLIKSVDLITVPQSKYAQDGYEAVININTVAGYLKGVLGTLATDIDTRGQTVSNAFALVEQTRVGFQNTLRYENTRLNDNTINRINTQLPGQPFSQQRGTTFSGTETSRAIVDLSGQFIISENTKASLYGSLGDILYRNATDGFIQHTPSSPQKDFNFQGKTDNDMRHNELGLNVISSNKTQTSLWEFRLKFSNDNVSDVSTNNFAFNPINTKTQATSSKWDNTELVGDINFTKKFKNSLSTDGFVRAISRTFKNNYESNPPLQFTTLPSISSALSQHTQLILQASPSIRKEWKNKILQLAFTVETAKYENTTTAMQSNSARNAVNFLPKATFKFPISKQQFIECKYNRTVTRPDYFSTGTFFSTANGQNISSGNLSLNQQITSEMAISTDGALFKGKAFYYISLSKNRINGSISQLSNYDSTSRVVITSFQAAGLTNSYLFLSGFYFRALKNRLNIGLNNTVGRYVFYDGNDRVVNKTIFNSFSGSVAYQHGATLSFNFLCFVNSLTPGFQGRETSTNNFQFNASKILYEGKLMVRIYVNDPFLTSRRFIKEISATDFTQESVNNRQARTVGISFSYRFGKLNPSSNYKRIVNTDLQGKK